MINTASFHLGMDSYKSCTKAKGVLNLWIDESKLEIFGSNWYVLSVEGSVGEITSSACVFSTVKHARE